MAWVDIFFTLIQREAELQLDCTDFFLHRATWLAVPLWTAKMQSQFARVLSRHAPALYTFGAAILSFAFEPT